MCYLPRLYSYTFTVLIIITIHSCNLSDQHNPKESLTSVNNNTNHKVEGELSNNAKESEKSQQIVRTGNTTSPNLEIVIKTPKENEIFQKKLVLVFNEEIEFPPDLHPKEYIQTIPKIEGIAGYSGNTLIFTTDNLPEQSESIRFCIDSRIRSITGKTLPEEKRCFELSLINLDVLNYYLVDANDDKFTIALEFTLPIAPNELIPFLDIADSSGKPLQFDILDGDKPQNTVMFSITSRASKPYKFILKPGYPNVNENKKGEGLLFFFPQPTPLTADIKRIEDTNELSIYFSDQMCSETLYKKIQITHDGNRVDFDLIPLDLGNATEKAIQTPNLDSKQAWTRRIIRYSKSWLVRLKRPSLIYSSNFEVKLPKYLSSVNFAILNEDIIWSTRSPADITFQIESAYWSSLGIKGPQCNIYLSHYPLNNVEPYIEIVPQVENLSIVKDEKHLLLRGDWKTNTQYKIKIKSGFPFSLDNTEENTSTLKQDYIYVLPPVPEYKAFQFVQHEKFYLIPYQGKYFIRIGSRNIPHAFLHLHQVIQENLPTWIRNIENNNKLPSELNERSTIYLKSIPVSFPNCIDRPSYVDVDLSEHLPANKLGLFTVFLSEESDIEKVNQTEILDEDWFENGGMTFQNSTKISSTIHFILWTQLGLVAHWNDKGAIAFVHDLNTLTPMSDAKISIFSAKNKLLAEGKTDSSGIYKTSITDKYLGKPELLIAQTDNDFTFTFLSPKPLPTLKDLEKFEEYDKDRLDAFIYTDRNLYRPGETIHARWVVRSQYGLQLTTAPVEIRLINPRNRIVFQKLSYLGNFGTGGEDIPTQNTFLTGQYNLSIFIPGGDTLCGSVHIYIEDFVPDRIKTEITLPEEIWVVGEQKTIGIQADYLLGFPAMNIQSEIKIVITPTELVVDKWKGYTFTNNEPLHTILMEIGQTQTNEAGKAELSFDFTPPDNITKPVEVAVCVNSSEMGGRPISTVKRVKAIPETPLCGLGVIEQDGNIITEVILVDKHFDLAEDEEIEVNLEKVSWRYVNRVYRRGSSQKILPQWEQIYTPIGKKVITTTNGRASIKFEKPQPYNTYRISTKRKEANSFTSINFYCLPDKIMSLMEGPPELIKLHLDNKKWKIGETVTIGLESPLHGKAFAVLQGEEIWDAQITDIMEGKGSVSFTIKPEYYPNIWLGVTGINLPNKSDGLQPYSSFSFIRIDVEKPDHEIQIDFPNLPSEIKPQTNLELLIHTQDKNNVPIPAEVTIALVDEGIHSITGYVTPDPWAYFGRTRYSPIQRTHYYDHVAYEYNPEPPGGDIIARQLSAGRATISESWIKPLSIWSGVLKTDDNGLTSFTCSIPEFNGKLRIVTVAINETHIGSAERYIYVRRPCVIQTQLPRFLRPHDKAIIFARAINTLSEKVKIFTKLIVDSDVQIIPQEFSWEIPPNQLILSPEIQLSYEGSTTSDVQIEWLHRIHNEQGQEIENFNDKTPIPIYKPSLYVQTSMSYAVDPGEIIHIDTNDFEENELLETEFKIGGKPFIQFEPAIHWLIHYPHSCSEQKASRLYVLYTLKEYIQQSMAEVLSTDEFNMLLQQQVQDIFNCQLPNGGLSLWHHSNEVCWKTTFHSGLLLALIQKDRQLNIPEKSYNKLMQFFRDVIQQTEREGLGIEAKALATLILAINGDPISCERLMSYLDYPLSRKTRVLLLFGAYICGHKKEKLVDYLEQLKWEIEETNETGEHLEFYTTKVTLHALKSLATIIKEESIPEILNSQKPLFEYLRQGNNYTTYELVYVILPLLLTFQKIKLVTDDYNAEINWNGSKETLKTNNTIYKKAKGNLNIEIKNTGSNTIYIACLKKGITRKTTLSEGSNSIILTMECIDKNYRKVELNKLKQGELYTLLFTINPSLPVESLILTQLLPSGLEIENPRLKPDATNFLINHLNNQDLNVIQPEHVEIRDDKLIIAFPELRLEDINKTYVYTCAVRAITRGDFEFPGARIEDMYCPEVYAQLPSQQIHID